jgi:hypothetical protein
MNELPAGGRILEQAALLSFGIPLVDRVAHP